MNPNVLKMGNQILRQVANPVDYFDDPSLKVAIQTLMETMIGHKGAGFAAPQVGVSKRIILIGGKTDRYPESVDQPVQIFLNPEYSPASKVVKDGWEACLSVPGMRGLVPRFDKIFFKAHDLSGKVVEGEMSGFVARVFQHECDHLDGILFPDRIKDLRDFGFENELVAKMSSMKKLPGVFYESRL